ncbi:3-hydroxy-9,10-secoandrosta-1,3,5(10)-triene-9,17-dione monooxygenase reductase subunit [Hoyosella altamirensis]|uniref:3-hydroxy-9,10-secoandrosta-1,3,5(10)-triene-9, 17-dione monooxygenase reductase component n=1 Tax=Hoyosella altamirensis TaxID=616997 RepID=A0A839RRV5_9ACTN|nr:3-hydroxy-9,10-secoandrosta-1,3,5(10)-triene-9,17-dione monooxygenase reductase component [Hoyosella altamirensis]
MGAPEVAIDPRQFRKVMGHFCTGVAVITASGDDGPVGFACQSFAALSLDPPLVLFCPAKKSRSWPFIESAGMFAVNVLGDDQRDVSSVFGAPRADKFDAVTWRPAASGAPLLTGALAWIDCTFEAVHDAGDHYIVVGRVLELGEPEAGPPLLFYRGNYTSTAPERTTPAPARESLESFLTWPCGDDWL